MNINVKWVNNSYPSDTDIYLTEYFSVIPVGGVESSFSRSKGEGQTHLQDLRHVIAHERRLSMRQRLGLNYEHSEHFRMWSFLHKSVNNLINC